MDNQNVTKKFYLALPILMLGMMGLVGCRAMEAKAKQEEAIDVSSIEVGGEQEISSGDLTQIESTPAINEVAPPLSEEDAIRAALAAHFELDESEFTRFEVEENTGMHARGGVAANDGGGYFLVAKVDGQWVFVDGGHAAPNCNEVLRFGFPASMVPDCELPSDLPTDSDEKAILAALAVHFELDESEFTRFEVVENTGMHARGGVAADDGGGYFLVAKVDRQWVFVDGGQAAPNCNEVARYGFPASMVPECPSGGSNAPDCPGLGSTVATFIADVTYPDGDIVSPGEDFTKTWRIKNAGTCTWNSGYLLIFESGSQMSGPDSKQLTSIHIPPGATLDISVELTAPETPGIYRGNWKFSDPYGNIFGLTNDSPIWVEIEVVDPDEEDEQSSYTGIPNIFIANVNENHYVTVRGLNFPSDDTFNVYLNYNGTLGIDGELVAKVSTGKNGEFTDTYTIPAFLHGQDIIAIRLESPSSGYYAFSWFYNS